MTSYDSDDSDEFQKHFDNLPYDDYGSEEEHSDADEKPPAQETSNKFEVLVLQGEEKVFSSRFRDEVLQDKNTRDITLKFKDETELRMSSTLLSSICQYFQVMLDSGMRETLEDKVHLPTVTHATFACLAAFTFGERVELETEEEFVDLMEAACMMQIQQLQDACVEALEAKLTLQNCWKTFFMVRRFHPTQVKRTPLFIASHMESLGKTDEWCSLDDDDICVILKAWGDERIAQHLQGQCTFSVVLDAILYWMEANDADPDIASRLLCSIPPAALDNAEIQDNLVDYSSSLIKNEAIRQKVMDHLKPEGDIMLLLFGSVVKLKDFRTDVYMYGWSEEERRDWVVPSMPNLLLRDFAFVKDGNTLIITGGLTITNDASRRMWIADESGWREEQLLLTPRSRHGMAMVNGRVFVVGGWPGPLKSIERHSPFTTDGSAYQVGKLKEAVYDCGVAHVKDKLVIVGGCGSDGPKNIIQTFHTGTHAVEVITLNELAGPEVNMGFTRYVGEMVFPFFLSKSGHLLELAMEDGTVKVQSQVLLKDFHNQAPFTAVLDSGEVVVCDAASGFSRYCRHRGEKLGTTPIRKLREDMCVHGIFWFFLPSEQRRINHLDLQHLQN